MAHAKQTTVRNRLLRAMVPEDFARLQPHLEPIDLQTGQTLTKPNAHIEHLHFMESGVTSITAESANGRVESHSACTWDKDRAGRFWHRLFELGLRSSAADGQDQNRS